VSLMPADHVDGWRPEVIAVLKSLRSGVYRWPGGNFVSAHDWRDAIGDPDQRPTIWDPVWNAVQSNDVGTDEFMALCRLTGVEPYITVNSGFGDARSAAEYVEYANSPATTPWGAKRAANGHPEPYRVKLWEVGNEIYGRWQVSWTTPGGNADRYLRFRAAMLKADPTIPKTVFTPSATRVSTSASLGVIFCLGMIFTSCGGYLLYRPIQYEQGYLLLFRIQDCPLRRPIF